jgi:hypothetical protein
MWVWSIYIKGSRELRKSLIKALFCPTNKKHEYLIRMGVVGQEIKMNTETF